MRDAAPPGPEPLFPAAAPAAAMGPSPTPVAAPTGDSFETDVPGRLDRLPWSRFHWLVVVALGITWILDGLEVTLVGSLAGAIHESPSLRLSEAEVGLTGSAYLVGAVSGAIFFGWLADRIGRRRLFFITLILYLVASIGTGLTWDFWSFALLRALTGAAIGGEYAAVNSAIQELIPARKRGTVDLVVNGTFWLGAALGSLSAVFVLDPALVPPEIGWRAAFIGGGVVSLVILALRRYVPESPRWLMIHGREKEAEAIIGEIERDVTARHGPLPPPSYGPVRFHRSGRTGMPDVLRAMFGSHRERAVLSLTLMACQAFCYNAVFFTYALVLGRFYGVSSNEVPWYLLCFAVGNFLGPLLLGRFFDTIGRKPMICGTYAIAGVLMAAIGFAFDGGWLSAWEQTLGWSAVFFFASAAASAAYLTVGESFPLEMRAVAIALFYAFGTALGGIIGPALFGGLVESGSRTPVMWGYILAAALMVLAAIVEWRLGFAAEGKPLEEVAAPLAASRRS